MMTMNTVTARRKQTLKLDVKGTIAFIFNRSGFGIMLMGLHRVVVYFWTLFASPNCVVRQANKFADFDEHSVNGLAVELQSLEERVETIENAVHAGNLSLQQLGEVLSCLCRDSTLVSCGTSPRSRDVKV